MPSRNWFGFGLLTACLLAVGLFLLYGNRMLSPQPPVSPKEVAVRPDGSDPRLIEPESPPPTATEPSPAPQTQSPPAEPQEDLLLTGLVERQGSCALFAVAEPGQPASYFALHEGEQNEWLEVRSINLQEATVKGLLKKPVMRMRTVGVEVVMSFSAQQGVVTP